MTKTQIVNVVATATVNQQIDFEKLRQHKEILHDQDIYGGRVAYYKNPKMQGRVSIFTSGKMISVGTKSETQAAQELEQTKQFLTRHGYIKPVDLTPKIQNIVATADFEKPINLEETAQKTNAIYEPEQFPGAIIRLNQPPKTTVLLFASGKAVIAGLTSSEQINKAIKEIEKIL